MQLDDLVNHKDKTIESIINSNKDTQIISDININDNTIARNNNLVLKNNDVIDQNIGDIMNNNF